MRMPLSKKRKKKAKKQAQGAQITVDPNKESAVTLQDLINVLAYQEMQNVNVEAPEEDEQKNSYVTKNNPTGEVRQCDRRDIHGKHDWQAEFGAYFDVTCLGNDGSTA